MPLPRTVLHSLLCTPCVIHTRSLYITPQLSQQSTMVYIRKDSMLYTADLRKSQGIRDVELLNKYFLRQICTQDYGLCLERSSITLPLHQGESYRSYIHTLQHLYWLQRVIEISNNLRSTCTYIRDAGKPKTYLAVSLMVHIYQGCREA